MKGGGEGSGKEFMFFFGWLLILRYAVREAKKLHGYIDYHPEGVLFYMNEHIFFGGVGNMVFASKILFWVGGC